MAAAAVRSILYTVGGYGIGQRATKTVEAYDPATNTWTAKALMPTARNALAAGVVNGILYAVGGGGTHNGFIVDTVEAYDPATNTWTAKTPMPMARDSLAAGTVNGMLYAVGGSDGFGLSNALEAFTP